MATQRRKSKLHEEPVDSVVYSCLDELYDSYEECSRCGLCSVRGKVCLGEGNPQAPIMIVGERPGREENIEGRPFVGKSGSLVCDVLAAIFNAPENFVDERFAEFADGAHTIKKFAELRQLVLEYCYITNAVMCVDQNDLEREPTTAQQYACRHRLMQEVYLVDPTVIIAFGKYAISSLTMVPTKDIAVTRMHGRPTTARIPGRCVTSIPYTVFPMFHPSYVLRKGDLPGPAGRPFVEALELAVQTLITYGEIGEN